MVDKKLTLPATEVFYRRAMERSAEIKRRVRALSAADILKEAGVPNMMQDRRINLTLDGRRPIR